MQENTGKTPWGNAYARQFFDVEYRLDYQIHTCSKPILCWGSGIVMGGGVGLMMGASHRVVSETTRFAMPEITIGLFPDVGGTWLLSRLPGGLGLFLALTAAHLGASDCRFLGVADYVLESARWPELVEQIQARTWSDDRSENDVLLHHTLLMLKPAVQLPAGPMQKNNSLINDLCGGPDFAAVCAGIAQLANHDDAWLDRAARTFKAGAPGSARLCFALLRRVRLLSLAQVFQHEYIVSLQCGVQGDFQEGIRALLIDKDKQPKWNPANLDGASEHWVQRFFEPAWPNSVVHPLADLGKD
jgi:enoyl-CoA hydratase/carnithine racemase